MNREQAGTKRGQLVDLLSLAASFFSMKKLFILNIFTGKQRVTLGQGDRYKLHDPQKNEV